MNPRPTRSATFAALLVAAAGCGYDSTARSYGPPSSSTDGLWLTSESAPAILRLSPEQLATSGKRSAATSVTTAAAALSTLSSIAFDAAGAMWIASSDDSQLLAFSPASLETTGSRAPSVVIRSAGSSLGAPAGLAFDAQHRLWVANLGNGTIVRFDPAQLVSSGAPEPAVVIVGLRHPTAIAFDASGDLWVSDIQAQRVVKYTPAQLAASGSPTPSVVLSTNGTSLRNPSGLAFDASGNLWVANTATATIAGFSQTELAATGSPAAHILVSSNAGALGVPTGLAFDGDGSLWIMGGEGTLAKLGRAALAASGAPVPSVQLQVEGHAFFRSVAFYPKPVGLPLNW